MRQKIGSPTKIILPEDMLAKLKAQTTPEKSMAHIIREILRKNVR